MLLDDVAGLMNMQLGGTAAQELLCNRGCSYFVGTGCDMGKLVLQGDPRQHLDRVGHVGVGGRVARPDQARAQGPAQPALHHGERELRAAVSARRGVPAAHVREEEQDQRVRQRPRLVQGQLPVRVGGLFT